MGCISSYRKTDYLANKSYSIGPWRPAEVCRGSRVESTNSAVYLRKFFETEEEEDSELFRRAVEGSELREGLKRATEDRVGILEG